MTTAFYEVLFGAHGSFEHAFVAARTALGGDAASLDWASLQLYARFVAVSLQPRVARPSG